MRVIKAVVESWGHHGLCRYIATGDNICQTFYQKKRFSLLSQFKRSTINQVTVVQNYRREEGFLVETGLVMTTNTRFLGVTADSRKSTKSASKLLPHIQMAYLPVIAAFLLLCLTDLLLSVNANRKQVGSLKATQRLS